MFDQRCERYWLESDYLPLEAVLDYWCGNNYECRKAKKFAIIAGCERDEIEYSRSDGEPWQVPVMELVGKDILLIKRDSFEKWVEKFRQIDNPNIPLNPTREKTYLKTIGALLEFLSGRYPPIYYGEMPQPHPAFNSEANLISRFGHYETRGLSKSTLEALFAEAKRTLASDL